MGRRAAQETVLVQRGSFRPVTNATLDVLERALEQFVREPDLKNEPPVVLVEMTLRHLTPDDVISHPDFLQRADMLRALGRTVFISNFRRFHRLASYLGRYTNQPIGLAIGAHRLADFRRGSLQRKRRRPARRSGSTLQEPRRLNVYPSLNFATGQTVTVDNFPVAPHLRHVYAHLTENHFIQGLTSTNADFLRIRSRDVPDKIEAGDVSWEKLVPPVIAEVIKREKLFGWRKSGSSDREQFTVHSRTATDL